MHPYFRAAVAMAVLGFSALLSACNRESEPRRYSEVAFHAKNSPMGGEASIHISWNLPKGWVEQPAGDPLRLASFLAPDSSSANEEEMDPKALDVSIVQLAGDAGGIPANISRWMGQVKIPPSPDIVKDIIAKAESLKVASGQKGIVVDFTGLLAGDMTRSTSIIGVILQDTGYTVFVKAKGDQDRLLKLRSQILDFSRSLSITEEKK